MKNRKRYGLQVIAIHEETHRMEQFTPRNLDVALAMVEGHALAHGRGWRYWIGDYSQKSEMEPIILENVTDNPGKSDFLNSKRQIRADWEVIGKLLADLARFAIAATAFAGVVATLLRP